MHEIYKRIQHVFYDVWKTSTTSLNLNVTTDNIFQSFHSYFLIRREDENKDEDVFSIMVSRVKNSIALPYIKEINRFVNSSHLNFIL